MDSTSIMMATSPGHIVPPPSLTNGHGSPYAADTTATNGLSPHSESDMSDSNEHAAAESASDVDAPGEEDDEEDVEMAQDSDSSDDVDAEGEADGDYDSDSPPPEQAESDDARSSASQESPRPLKRKSSPKGDDYITQNPELYGLRRSGRARPHRRVVSYPRGLQVVILTGFRLTAAMKMVILTRMCLASVSAQPRVRLRSSLHQSIDQPGLTLTLMATSALVAACPPRRIVSGN
jgi:hypothetical protein